MAVSRSVEFTGGYFFNIVFRMHKTSPSLSCAVTLRASPTSIKQVHNMRLLTNQLGHVEPFPRMHHLVSSRHNSISAMMYNSWTQRASETYSI